MRRTVRMMAVALALPSLGLSYPALAQGGAVVQPLPPAAAVERLNSHLARLSRSPQDVEALLGAGQAALDLGDAQAANGFFTRANIINPNSGRAKLGLAVVQLALKHGEEAAANFDAAEALGEPIGAYLADRGLAYDLTGQQAKAQRDYQTALRANPGDAKASMRYAVSLGISGRAAEADKILEPILSAGDREGWRFRAFIFAMNGRQAEARSITQSVMPKGLADALDPYLVRTPLLTAAQKAAAAHFGDFPANVLRMTAPAAGVVIAAAEPPKTIAEPVKREETDRPSRSKDRRGRDGKGDDMREARDEPKPALAAAAPAQSGFIPASPPPTKPSGPVLVPPPPPPPVVDQQEPVDRPAPIFAPVVQRPVMTARPVIQRTAQPAPQSQQGALAAAISSLTVPAEEKVQAPAVVDAVSLAQQKAEKRRKDAEAKAKAEKEAKAREEAEKKKLIKANPSRTWVQIAAGRNTSALGFDLRRYRKSYAEAMGDETGWFADWGATNRLLIGPYRKIDSAKDVVAKIKKAGGDAFVWQSEAGEVVKKIGDQ